jgi:type II secretory pathway component PulJ
MVAVTILAIIMGVITAAMVVSFRTTDEASDRLARAHDVQISTSAFASDVQSADAVILGSGTPACGAASLSFVWTDPNAGPTPVVNVVSYRVDGTRLLRSHCKTGGIASTYEQVLSHNVKTASAPSCDGLTCTGPKPREVAWAITDTSDAAHTLRGTRRSYT